MATLAKRLGEVEDRDGLVDVVVPGALALLGADGVHLGLVDQGRGRLRILVNAGSTAEWELRLPETETYLLSEYPQLVHASDPTAVWRAGVQDEEITENDRSLLVSLGKSYAMSVPVLVAGRVWGELFFTRTRPVAFSDQDQSVATILAALVGAGVARLDGDDRLRRLAYTDALTGLANRRRADEQLVAWTKDPVRSRQVAAILCDVNDLKRVNDTLGHTTGDRLLRDLANLVSEAAGRLPQGISARIGGDEFLIAGCSESRSLLTEVAADLTAASHRLPLGSGLSCGIAWAGELARLEATPTDHVSALLRLADADQYQHKRDARQAGELSAVVAAPSTSPMDRRGDNPARSGRPGEVGASRHISVTSDQLAAATSSLIHRLGAADVCGDVEERIVDVAATLCEASGAAAWWVSSVSADLSSVSAKRCGTPRAVGLSDGQWPTVVVDPTAYRLDEYPATAAIVAGGSFAVDATVGEPAERRLLIQTGFASMIAAGGTDRQGAAWLVEIYGDALTTDLHRNRPLLEALLAGALTG